MTTRSRPWVLAIIYVVVSLVIEAGLMIIGRIAELNHGPQEYHDRYEALHADSTTHEFDKKLPKGMKA